MTKEIAIRKLEKEATNREAYDMTALQIEIVNVRRDLKQKMLTIEELRNRTGYDRCDDHESDDDLTSGACTKSKLKRRVFKKIEALNEHIRNVVTPEIHQRYTGEIEKLMRQHYDDIHEQRIGFEDEIKNQANLHETKI